MKFLTLAAIGQGGPAEISAAYELAAAVLSNPAVTLAVRVVQGGPDARAAAIELAALALQQGTSAELPFRVSG
jgi:hypothetical protein